MKVIKITEDTDLLLIARIATLKERYESLFETAKRLGMVCKMPILRQSEAIYVDMYNQCVPEFYNKYNIPLDSELHFDLDNMEVYYEEI